MKSGILKVLTIGLSCLVLTITLSSNLSSHNNLSNKPQNTMHVMEDSPTP